MVREGTFTMLSEVEMIEEQQRIINQLDGTRSKYGNNHAVNLLIELDSELPQDKIELLSTIERFLTLDHERQLNFIFGRRQGYYSGLDDMQQRDRYALVRMEMDNRKENSPDQRETLFHTRRKRRV